MKVVVAGATGLIGAPLCRALIRAGHEVTALTRDPASARDVLGPEVKAVEWEAKNAEPLTAALEGQDAVVHLAGENVGAKRWSRKQMEMIRSSRIESTRAIVLALGKASRRPTVFVSGSAVGFYGPRDDTPLTESADPGNDFLAKTCLEWEAEARGAEALGIRVVLLRTGIVLAEKGGVLAKMRTPFKWFIGGPPGNGRQWFPWIHVDDVVGIIVLALSDSKARGAINATAPGIGTMKQFCKTLGNVLHRPSFMKVPRWVLRITVGRMSGILVTGQRVVPREAERLGYSFKYPELEPALRDVLHRPE